MVIVQCVRPNCHGVLLVDEDNRRYCWACGRFADPIVVLPRVHVEAPSYPHRALIDRDLERKREKAAAARERRYRESHCVSKQATVGRV
jgi:hypothetical protein